MEKSTSEKFKLGIFVILGTVLLVIAVYLIGKQNNMFDRTFAIYTVFKNVNGLREKDNVRYSGINVGTVEQIEMVNDTTVKVTLEIQKEMQEHIKTNAVATIGSDGIVGNIIVSIVPGKEPGEMVKSGDRIRAKNKTTTAAMLGTLSKTNKNTEEITKNLLKITESLNAGAGTLGKLLNDTIMSGNLSKSLENLKRATDGMNQTIKSLDNLVASINIKNSAAGALLNDSTSGQNVRDIIGNLKIASGKINHVSDNLDSITTAMAKGNGAINYLTTDTTLVNNLQSIMKNADKGVERFSEDMEALKHNFLFRHYFKKQEKEKEKEVD